MNLRLIIFALIIGAAAFVAGPALTADEEGFCIST